MHAGKRNCCVCYGFDEVHWALYLYGSIQSRATYVLGGVLGRYVHVVYSRMLLSREELLFGVYGMPNDMYIYMYMNIIKLCATSNSDLHCT